MIYGGATGVFTFLGFDSFKVSLYSPNGRHFPGARIVPGDYQKTMKNSRNSHTSRESTMHRDMRQSQLISILSNHKRVLPPNWMPWLIPHGQPYCHDARTLQQSILGIDFLPPNPHFQGVGCRWRQSCYRWRTPMEASLPRPNRRVWPCGSGGPGTPSDLLHRWPSRSNWPDVHIPCWRDQ